MSRVSGVEGKKKKENKEEKKKNGEKKNRKKEREGKEVRIRLGRTQVLA